MFIVRGESANWPKSCRWSIYRRKSTLSKLIIFLKTTNWVNKRRKTTMKIFRAALLALSIAPAVLGEDCVSEKEETKLQFFGSDLVQNDLHKPDGAMVFASKFLFAWCVERFLMMFVVWHFGFDSNHRCRSVRKWSNRFGDYKYGRNEPRLAIQQHWTSLEKSKQTSPQQQWTLR